MGLDGKVAIVTGGAKGIGYAIARRFLHDGAKVVIADIDERAADAAVDEMRELGDIRSIACDVSKRLDVHNLVAATADAFGDIDILVNNAGIIDKGDFLEISDETFDSVIAINLKGSFLCGQAVARHLVEKVKAGGHPGTIINMSSINAVFGLPNQIAYSVSKGGIAQLTRSMAQSLAPYGIRVNAVGPGSTMTDMLKNVFDDPEATTRIMSRTPLGRIGEPREMAAVAAFLASDEASYITGQTIYADGGRLGLNFTVSPREVD